jgi:aspartyl aminopeptidase
MGTSAQDLIDYLEASPSPFHCVAESAARLEAAGFQRCKEDDLPSEMPAGHRGYLSRGGTLVAWISGSESPADVGFRILGAHTDSPNLRLKPNAESTKEGYVQWGLEVYGGPILATWTDRDLGLAGRVSCLVDGTLVQRLVRVDEPIARIPNVAIHYNREVNKNGLKLNAQKHLPAVVAQGEPGALRALLAQAADCPADAIKGWDLGLFDLQAPRLGGINDEFVFSARLDNQFSCYAALEGLLNQSAGVASTSVLALFDHEEVGSQSATGARSVFLEFVLARLLRDHPVNSPGGLARAVGYSFMVSSDMAHGVHPNYSDYHDANHKPQLNGGPVLKSNASLSYATDGEAAARFRMACEAEGLPIQEHIHRTDLRCGSTVGPMVAAGLAIRTVDVGSAMLSMHSIREQAGAQDAEMLARVLTRILAS